MQAKTSTFKFETEARVASTGYIGIADRQHQTVTPTLDELVGPGSEYGMDLLPWDGRTPIPIVSPQDGRVYALLAGSPANENWKEVADAAAELLETKRGKISPSKNQRRGWFTAANYGIFHGGGGVKPGNLIHTKTNNSTLKSLCQHWSFKRLSGFANGIFKAWAPRLWSYYSTNLDKLLKSDSSLKLPFSQSVWSTMTFNFGPQTVCFPHIDFSNLPFGWCAIWALGDFDPKRGGHLILWDLNLVIEFPPGSLILIPSGGHEKRYSFTQFTPGALFRWVDNGFQTQHAYHATRTDEEAQNDAVRTKNRWAMGLELLSTISELNISSTQLM
ncbi:hypothetical protein K435DRAFT_822833 [Dendrothele bispora CBS 962.96]|uniref:Uncharacterized protein n=1 Tax=Dendrothele bispora (strain CBS 962.96) TaxID=1314807 RepID=A0A4V4HCP7_DENBC|nr:hypothetical protein K435DRAFT_822833 [Dendrothele bispora CBS 962.96]